MLDHDTYQSSFRHDHLLWLRLLYEAAPLAFIAEQAGGYASDGRGPILDITPSSLHQRTPLFIGNRDLVVKVEDFIRGLDD